MTEKILIIAGSRSDSHYIDLMEKVAEKLDLSVQVEIISAHRNIVELIKFIEEHSAEFEVIICIAGHSAPLAGVVAGLSEKPVLAVPLPQSDLKGVDSLLSTVMMPKGVPVAVMSIGNAGAINAVLFAAKIIALKNARLLSKIKGVKDDLSSL